MTALPTQAEYRVTPLFSLPVSKFDVSNTLGFNKVLHERQRVPDHLNDSGIGFHFFEGVRYYQQEDIQIPSCLYNVNKRVKDFCGDLFKLKVFAVEIYFIAFFREFLFVDF